MPLCPNCGQQFEETPSDSVEFSGFGIELPPAIDQMVDDILDSIGYA